MAKKKPLNSTEQARESQAVNQETVFPQGAKKPKMTMKWIPA